MQQKNSHNKSTGQPPPPLPGQYVTHLPVPQPLEDSPGVHVSLVVLERGLEERQLEEDHTERPDVHLLADDVPLEQVHLLGRPVGRRGVPADVLVRGLDVLLSGTATKMVYDVI